MEAAGCGPDEAREIVEGFERDGASARQMYRWLQELDRRPDRWSTRRRLCLGPRDAAPGRGRLRRRPLPPSRPPSAGHGAVVRGGKDRPGLLPLGPLFRRRRWPRPSGCWRSAKHPRLPRRHSGRTPARGASSRTCCAIPSPVLRALRPSSASGYDPAMAGPTSASSARMTDGLYADSRMLGDVKVPPARPGGCRRGGAAGDRSCARRASASRRASWRRAWATRCRRRGAGPRSRGRGARRASRWCSLRAGALLVPSTASMPARRSTSSRRLSA